jgi:hypothetical protein
MRIETGKKSLIFLCLLIYVPFLFRGGRLPSSVLDQDLLIPYSAANLVFVGHQSPYDYRVFSRVGRLTGEGQPQPFLYPPPSLLLFFPFSRMSFEAAKIGMLVVSHISLLLFLYIFFFRIMGWQREYLFAAAAFVYVCAFHPLAVTLTLGQINLVLLLCLTLAWFADARDWHPALVALPLTLAIGIKIYPVLFLFYFLVKKKYAVVVWAVAISLAASGAAYLLLPAGIWPDWVAFVLPSGGYARVAQDLINPTVPWNQSINGFLSRFFIKNSWSQAFYDNPFAARVLTWLSSLLVLLVSLGISTLAQKTEERKRYIHYEFSILLLAVFIVAPFSWDHHLVMILPAVLFALSLLVSTEKNRLAILAVGVSVLLLGWGLPLASPDLKKGLLTLGISVKFYAALGIWAYLISKMAGELIKRSGKGNIKAGLKDKPAPEADA